MQITIREPGSAITHFIAMMMAVFAAVPLLVKAGVQSGQENFLAMAIFMGSMILLTVPAPLIIPWTSPVKVSGSSGSWII